MGKTDDIIRLMQHLQNNGIKVTNLENNLGHITGLKN